MYTHVEKDFLFSLRSQNTWRLFFLGLITYGVYYAHHVKNLTDDINEHYDHSDQISDGLVSSFLALSYVSLGIFIIFLLLDESHQYFKTIDVVDTVLTIVWQIMLLVWAFKAKTRINFKMGLSKGAKDWFKGIWTFFFAILYVNFKLNKLKREIS